MGQYLSQICSNFYKPFWKSCFGYHKTIQTIKKPKTKKQTKRFLSAKLSLIFSKHSGNLHVSISRHFNQNKQTNKQESIFILTISQQNQVQSLWRFQIISL